MYVIEHLLYMENTSEGLFQHSGLSLATETAGYNKSAAALGVSTSDLYAVKPKILMMNGSLMLEHSAILLTYMKS